jgi:hypothetical protein
MPVVGPMEGTLKAVLEGKILLSFRKGAWDRVRKWLVPLYVGGRSR